MHVIISKICMNLVNNITIGRGTMKAKIICLSLVLILAICSCFIISGCSEDTSNEEPEQLQTTTEDTPNKEPKQPKATIEDQLEQFMSAYNQYHSYKYNGTVLVAQGDKILLNKAYGVANVEKGEDNTIKSVFPIGSITKSFTAVSIMQLEEKGLLSLDDPISKHIDGHERGDDITIHHLLTHTSGLTREGKFIGGYGVPLNENVEYIAKNNKIQFEPGEDFLYSNAGYIILAGIIEKISGESYNDYIKNNIFDPLDMEASRCGVDNTYAEDQPIGYRIQTGEPSPLKIYSFMSITGSGNLYSTTQDMFKYSRSLCNETLLTHESLDKIFTPHYGNWSSYGYGYGWDLTERYGHKKLSHGGCIGNGGYNSLMIRFPEQDYVLIFLTNNDNRIALEAVSQSLEAIVFGEDYVIPQELIRARVDEELLKQYVGSYKFQGNFTLSVRFKDGNLYSTADDGKEYEIIPASDTTFIYEDRQCTKAEFVTDDEGNLTIRIYSKTNKIDGKKIN